MRVLVIGRFQPFHNGHLQVIQEISEEADAVIVGIGSAQASHTLDDPFTAGERHLMISKSLESNGILDYYLVPIADIDRYSIWVSHVESLVPPFDVVVARNPLTQRLFKESGYEVKAPPAYDRSNFSGKEVRRRMISGGDWHSLVPKGTVDVVNEIQGIERLKHLAIGDE